MFCNNNKLVFQEFYDTEWLSRLLFFKYVSFHFSEPNTDLRSVGVATGVIFDMFEINWKIFQCSTVLHIFLTQKEPCAHTDSHEKLNIEKF